mmetsp:Transcript_29897/g.91770  ORF Transcript_29897/g.91770 Transcript_29897/m.91770 type:complete len:234 (+) Transcript_29897:1481-2182(+)
MSASVREATQPSIVALLVPVMASTFAAMCPSPISFSTSEMVSSCTRPCTIPTGMFHKRKSMVAITQARTLSVTLVRLGVSSERHSASRNWGAGAVRKSTGGARSERICTAAAAARRVRKSAVYMVTSSRLDVMERNISLIAVGAEPSSARHVFCNVTGSSSGGTVTSTDANSTERGGAKLGESSMGSASRAIQMDREVEAPLGAEWSPHGGGGSSCFGCGCSSGPSGPSTNAR